MVKSTIFSEYYVIFNNFICGEDIEKDFLAGSNFPAN